MTTDTEPNNKGIPYEETTFSGLLGVVGTKELYKNWSFFWALLITAWIVVYELIHGTINKDFLALSGILTGNLLGASAGIFGIVIAALSVTVALFHQSLLPVMLKSRLLHKFLFPFWYAVVLWAINIVFCIILLVLTNLKQECIMGFAYSIGIFFFLYATFYTVSLTGLVIRLALQKAQIKQ